MKKIVLLWCAIQLSLCVYAQTRNVVDYLGYEKRISTKDPNLEGSPYLIDVPSPGYIVFKANNYKLENIKFMYNALENTLDVEMQDAVYVVKIEKVKEFSYEEPESKRVVLFKNVSQ